MVLNPRERCALDLCFLTHSTRPTIWNLSDNFLEAKSIDSPCYSPLDTVAFDSKTCRYKSITANAGKGRNLLHDDDFILQAMVMLTLSRLNYKWGCDKMMAELTIWQHPKKPTESTLPNLWANTIRRLQQQKGQLGKSLEHIDIFCTWCRCFVRTEGRTDRRARRSHNCRATNSFILAEQAAVQWALDAVQNDPHLAELAVRVIRLQFLREQQDESEHQDNDGDGDDNNNKHTHTGIFWLNKPNLWVPKLLADVANKTKQGDDKFSKKALLAMETYGDLARQMAEAYWKDCLVQLLAEEKDKVLTKDRILGLAEEFLKGEINWEATNMEETSTGKADFPLASRKRKLEVA